MENNAKKRYDYDVLMIIFNKKNNFLHAYLHIVFEAFYVNESNPGYYGLKENTIQKISLINWENMKKMGKKAKKNDINDYIIAFFYPNLLIVLDICFIAEMNSD